MNKTQAVHSKSEAKKHSYYLLIFLLVFLCMGQSIYCITEIQLLKNNKYKNAPDIRQDFGKLFSTSLEKGVETTIYARNTAVPKENAKNLFNGNWILNADIKIGTGIFRENAGVEYIAEKEFIKVSPNEEYKLKVWKNIADYTSATLFVAQYSVENEQAFTSITAVDADTLGTTYLFIPTTPYIRFMFCGDNKGNTRFLPKLTLLHKSSDYMEYEPFNKTEEDIYNTLNGKNIVSCGDSVAFGGGYTDGYVGLIAERNNMNFINYGQNGWTMAAGFVGDGICTVIEKMDVTADYCLIEGGQNDWFHNVPLGTLTADMTSSLDKNTFYGALEYAFQKAIHNFYNTKIVYVLHHKHKKAYCTQNGIGLTEQDYVDAIKKTCDKYSIKIADVWSESHFNTEYDVYNQYTMLITQDGETYGDGAHPNREGYLRYYVPIIENAMKSN